MEVTIVCQAHYVHYTIIPHFPFQFFMHVEAWKENRVSEKPDAFYEISTYSDFLHG